MGDSGWNHHSNNGSWILLILIQATGQLQRESFSVKFDPWEVAKVLIHFKVDVKKTDIYGQTSIFYGIEYGRLPVDLCSQGWQCRIAAGHNVVAFSQV